MKYKLYTREIPTGRILEEPGDGPACFYEARSLKAAEEKCRHDVEVFNSDLRRGEEPREFVRVESEDDWCDVHPDVMATDEAIMDFYFMHWLSDDDGKEHLRHQANMVLSRIALVMKVFKGERSKSKRDLAVQKLEEWLRAAGCDFEADLVGNTDRLRANATFLEYGEQLRDALCGYLPASKLRAMFADNGRWDKRGTTGTA